MKSPFSPWWPYGLMIAACVAPATYVAVGRHLFRLPGQHDAAAPGIVRSLRDEPGGAAAKTQATVQLFDGSVVQGDVAAGCLVFVGDRVVVTDAGGPTASVRPLVFPESPH